jgi:hypothetical protein
MLTAQLLLWVLIGVVIQVMVIALAVYWGTSGIRRELFELRRDMAYLERE